MKRFELVNGSDLETAREVARGVRDTNDARRVRTRLLEEVVEPVVRREGRRAVHLAAVALDDGTINLNHAKRPEGSEPVVLDLRSQKEDSLNSLRPKVASKPPGLFDRVRRQR